MEDVVVNAPAAGTAGTTENTEAAGTTENVPSAYDRKLAKLAEKEASIRSMKQEAEGLKSKYSKFDEIMSNPKANVLKAIEHLGLSFEDIADAVLNADVPVDPVAARLEALEKERADEKQKIVDAENERILDSIKTDIVRTAKNFELINLTNSEQLVFDTLNEIYEKTGRVHSIQSVCEMVEAELEEQASVLTKSQKLAAKFGISNSEKSNSTTENVRNKPNTLLQNSQSQVATQTGAGLSKEERRAKAVALLKQIN